MSKSEAAELGERWLKEVNRFAKIDPSLQTHTHATVTHRTLYNEVKKYKEHSGKLKAIDSDIEV